MRVVIVGAGALGGLVGAYLSEAGEDVVLVEVNQSRVRLLKDVGLFLSEGNQGERCVRLKVVGAVGGLAPADLVFVAVKSYQTERAVQSMLPVMAPGTFVLSMQNGIGNTETMAKIVQPDRVLCGITYHSIQHVGPNRLRYRPGIKPIQIAPYEGGITPEIEAIGEMFRRAGLDTNVVENIDNTIWQKLLHNAVVNPVSALTGLTCQEILEDDDLLAFMRELCMEVVSVMRARGISIVNEEDPFEPVLGSLRALGKNRPSMWQDLSRASRTEVDAINGAVVDEAEKLGINASHNRALVRFIHSRERQKLLRQQGVPATIKTVGEYRPEAGPAPIIKPRMRPVRMAPEGGMPLGRVPMQCRPKLKELLRQYYQDLQTASDDPNRLVACCSGQGPVEILRAMGITPYFPQNHAALIAASRQTGSYIPRALSEGLPHSVSSAMASDIGALLVGDSPLVSVYGIAGAPNPDLVVFNTSYGQHLIPWFEWYGSHFNVPVVSLHPPWKLAEIDAIDITSAALQFHRFIGQLEEITGRKLDMDRLAEVVDLSNHACTLWGEILAKAKNVPTPLTFFDALIHMAPIIVLRGTEQAVQYYEILKTELDERIANHVAAVPGERYRFYWEGPPIWCGLRPLAELYLNNDVAIVASTYCEVSALEGLDGKNPIESMARTYTSLYPNRSNRYREHYLLSRFQEYGVDGVIYHESRTAPERSTVRCGLEMNLRRISGLHSLIIEADSHDLRLLSMDRITRKLEDFIEMQEMLRKDTGSASTEVR